MDCRIRSYANLDISRSSLRSASDLLGMPEPACKLFFLMTMCEYSQMSGGHNNPLSIALLQSDDQSHILGLPTPSSTFLAVLVRQSLFVEVDRLRRFALEAV
jgi:hypothetical protein